MSEPAPWRVLRSRLVLADRWIRLRADSCLVPSGAVLDPFYVLEYRDWVHVVALTADDQLVLNRQYRHAAGEVHLELPGGVMEEGESDPLLTARRELREETGFAAREWRYVVALRPNPATHTNRVHTVLALDAHYEGEPQREAGEEIAVALLPLQEVLRRLPQGGLQQSTHVASLLLALVALGRVRLW